MNKHIALILLLSASLFLSGCIDMESVVTVKKDGSGTIEETTLLSAQMAAMMAMATAGLPQQGGGPPQSGPNLLVTEEQAKTKATQMGPGVTLQGIETLKTADGRQGQKVVYAFTDIAKVQYQQGDPSAVPAAAAAGASANPITFAFSNGTLTVKNGSSKPTAAPPLPTGPGNATPPAGAPPATPLPSDQEVAMMKTMFTGMRVAFKVKSASGIASTDATFVDGDTVTLMDLQMDKLFDNVAVLGKLSTLTDNPNISPAAASEALKGIDGVKAEVKDTITIKLK